MLKIGRTYTHEDSPLAITIVQVTFEGPEHYRVLAITYIKDEKDKPSMKIDGLKEYNIDKETLASGQWHELPKQYSL